MKLRTLAVLAGALCIAAAGAALGWQHWTGASGTGSGGDAPPGARVDVSEAERAPEGERIRAQVLNATRTRGLARPRRVRADEEHEQNREDLFHHADSA